jgi:dihydropteroate synthase
MTINCKGKLIDLSTPKVMGILNVTPDSFYDGGTYSTISAIVEQVAKMLEEGADFIDLGAYSSRPSADFVSEQEELARIVPAVQTIVREFPDVLLSIDTFRSGVARQCMEEGAAIINDITAGLADPAMMDVVAKMHAPYIMMHMKGTPETMQSLTQYENIITEMMYYFSERIAAARTAGIADVIVDPGFGFAKTLDHNYEIFSLIGVPMLVGISRKSMIYNFLKADAAHALNGTTVLNTVALQKGANILRVHDVKQAVECIKMYGKLESARIH